MGKILHVTTCYAGGVSRAINTAVRLSPDHEHHLLWEGTEEPDLNFGFASTRRLPSSVFRYVAAANIYRAEIAPDLIHAHSSWAGVLTRVQKSGPEKLIYEPHCYKFDDPDLNRVLATCYRTVERILSSRSDVTVVLSPHEAELARSLSSRGRTHYVPNAPHIHPEQKKGVLRKRQVVMVGRLADQKDPDFYAAVCQLVKSQDPSVIFKWVGDGDLLHKARLESNGVEVTGWLDPEALESALHESQLYFHSAKYEGFPLSVLDAAVVGLPVIARSISALDGTSVWQVRNTREAAEAILGALNDESSRKRAMEGAARLLVDMNEDTQKEALGNLYSTFGPADRASQILVGG